MSQPVAPALQFHRRPDGWPLCPCCGEDELWSTFVPQSEVEARLPNYLVGELRCLGCSFVVPPCAALAAFMAAGGSA